MAHVSTSDLLNYLRAHAVLDAAALREAEVLASRSAADFLLDLKRRRWLTTLQCERLLDGKPIRLGSYVLLDLIGKGGMGEVYRARHANLNRIDALKTIRPDCLSQADQVKRFEREARAAARLHHPNIVTIYDADQDQGVHFIAMEFVEGTDLAKMLKEHGPLPVGAACNFARQAALGLQHAHEHGLIHRDIKPSNLIVTHKAGSDPVLKILDFGLARLASEEDGGLTPAGQWLGTPEFIAPEQACDSANADGRADIFSLGCVLFVMLSGRTPFPGSSSTERLAARFAAAAPPLRSLSAQVSAEVDWVVQKMLARNPGERYRTGADVAAALEPWAAPVPAHDPLLAPTQSAVSMFSKETTPQRPAHDLAGPSDPTSNAPIRADEPSTQSFRPLSDTPVQPRPVIAPSAIARWLVPAALGLALVGLAVLVGPHFFSLDGDEPSPSPSPSPSPIVANGKDKKPAEPEKYIVNSIKLKLVRIPPGKFLMGSPQGEPEQGDDEAQHEVVIGKHFYLGVYEVTQGEYLSVMGENPSHFSAKGPGAAHIVEKEADRYPVERVSWNMANSFCKLLSQQPLEKAAGRTYRLPTEEEWEYACRAGTTGPFHYGDSLSAVQANFDGKRPYGAGNFAADRPHTLPVGKFEPNAFGLFDMHGNVWEWCQDTYISYADKVQNVVRKLPADAPRVVRGGGWNFSGAECRSARRLMYEPNRNTPYYGFRVVCDVTAK